jgi:hypothetical protein
MAKQFFHFRLRSGEFVLPNDQFVREPRRFDGSKPFEDIERHTGHSD